MDIDGAIEMLEEVFGSFDAVDGIPLANLHDATRQLTVALPEALETLYRRTGRSGRLHHGPGHLVAPSDLKVASGHLLIYIENQSASVFGIPIGEHASDPPVDISFEPDLAGATWERAFERFSHFVAVQGAWQAIRGGVQASALVTATTIPGIAGDYEHREKKFAEASARVARERVAGGGSTIWTCSRCILAVENGVCFGVGATDEDTFFAVSAELGMSLGEWSYASVRDE